MKTLLIFAFLGLAIGAGHVWAIALYYELPWCIPVIGAAGTVLGGVLAGLTAASDDAEA